MDSTVTADNLDLIMDVQVELSVMLGSTRLPMKELLALAPGAILQLDQHAGEPVKLLVNGNLAAFGEVVVVDDRFGIKITEIVSNKTDSNKGT